MAVQVLEVHLEAVESVDERDGHVGVEVVAPPLEFGVRPGLEKFRRNLYFVTWFISRVLRPDESSSAKMYWILEEN